LGRQNCSLQLVKSEKRQTKVKRGLRDLVERSKMEMEMEMEINRACAAIGSRPSCLPRLHMPALARIPLSNLF